jgi:hypothetical protein
MKLLRSIIVLAAVLCIASCAHPPQAEIDAAQAALDAAAKNADVVTYAPDSLRVAQEKMAELGAEIAAQARRSALSRTYDTATSLALEAGADARRAIADAAAAKRQVARDASALVEEVSAGIPQFESKVWAAKRVPRIRLDVINPMGLIPQQARTTIEDANRDIAAGSYAAAKAKLMAVKDKLSNCQETILEQTRIAHSH